MLLRLLHPIQEQPVIGQEPGVGVANVEALVQR